MPPSCRRRWGRGLFSVSWNVGAERIKGYQPHEIIGKHFSVFYLPEDAAAGLPQRGLRQALANEFWEGEGWRRRKDGSRFWADVAISALRDQDGTLRGFAKVTRDVTERRQAQEALRASEERFRATFEQAAVGISHVDLDGRWLLVNRRLCDIVGYPQDELLAKTFQDITHPADLETDLALLRRLVADEIPSYAFEKRYIHKQGHPIWINLTVSVVRDQAGQPRYFIAVVEDIMARKQAEAELRELTATLEQRVAERTAELAEVNQELERFTYSVAHDLRAPLRGLQGLAQVLHEDYAGVIDEVGQEYLRHLGLSAAQMDRLIQDLLAYSRLSRSEIQLQPVDLGLVVQEAIGQLGSDVQATEAQVVVAEGLPGVQGHVPTLIQVVGNLLSNAVKFVGPGLRPRVHVWAEQRNSTVRLWVEDNGIGVAPQHQSRIWDVFERLHGVEAYPGTGIGLAIVRKGVERMGGAVGVVSEVGVGSKFWLELPKAE
jgi:PAS domain S-box-containing protein